MRLEPATPVGECDNAGADRARYSSRREAIARGALGASEMSTATLEWVRGLPSAPALVSHQSVQWLWTI